MNVNGSLIQVYLDPEIIKIAQGKDYPKWIKRCIKRKYKNNPAIYLDVWIPYRPNLTHLIPKRNIGKIDWSKNVHQP